MTLVVASITHQLVDNPSVMVDKSRRQRGFLADDRDADREDAADDDHHLFKRRAERENSHRISSCQ